MMRKMMMIKLGEKGCYMWLALYNACVFKYMQILFSMMCLL